MANRGKPSYFSYTFFIGAVLIAAAVVLPLAIRSARAETAAVAAILGAAVFVMLFSSWQGQKMAYLADRLMKKNAERIDKYLNAASIPTAIATEKGRILWHNPAFFLLSGRQTDGANIYRLFERMNKPDASGKIKIGDKVYIREDIRAEADGRRYVIHRFIDAANARETVDLYKNALSTVCHVQVDNYGDLLRGVDQNMHAGVIAEIERVIARNAKNMRAAYQKYDRDKFILLFERRYLSGPVQNRFAMLEEAKKIDTGSAALQPTFSLGVGTGSSPSEANANALKALEMALGRGGDQAVVRDEAGFKYYGGVQQGREKRTRVRTRTFSRALKNLMEQSDGVMIMGHAVPDLDCMGAALGVLACARGIGKRARIVMDKPNVTIQRLLDIMRQDPAYKGVLVSPAEAEGLTDAKTMLVVMDTQIADFTIAPQLFRRAGTLVVIDHHVRGTDYIENPTLFLHEPYASSTAEMATEIVQYFAENVTLRPMELDALFSGIMIDTKGFSFKTGVRTFEAASFLKRMGADMARVRHMFQDDLKTFTARAKVVEGAEVLKNGVAISICPQEIENPQLLAAQAADSLLGISGIAASFVLCEQDGYILISGRSLGEVNVQRVLEKMGGGGHATIAGAQMRGKKMADVVETLKSMIAEYEKEV